MNLSLFKSEYPFASHYFDREGLNYHYLDEGAGDPLVMVHGNPSWSFYYRNLVKELRSDYRIIVPDHIGCGFSDKPDDTRYSYTLQQRVDDLDALLDHLAIGRRVTLVVHDWGGMIGMAWASRHPDRVARLVVLNTAAFHLPEAKGFPLGLKICRETALGGFLVRGLNLFARGAAWVGCKKNPMPLALQNLYCAPYNSWRNRIATLRFVQDIPLTPEDRGYDLVSQVEKGLPQFSDVPLCICWGEKDFVFDRKFLSEWRRHFPHAEVHPFPDCGHYILEDAKDRVIPIIAQFLRDHPLTSAAG